MLFCMMGLKFHKKNERVSIAIQRVHTRLSKHACHPRISPTWKPARYSRHERSNTNRSSARSNFAPFLPLRAMRCSLLMYPCHRPRRRASYRCKNCSTPCGKQQPPDQLSLRCRHMRVLNCTPRQWEQQQQRSPRVRRTVRQEIRSVISSACAHRKAR